MKIIKISYAEELQNSFDRWDHLYKNGGSDPFYADGTNMNLVRYQISYWKHKIEEAYPEEEYPDIYSREMPPEVSQDYMARSDEIRERAKRSLAIYKQNENRNFLQQKILTLDEKSIKSTCIQNVLNYVAGLEIAIEKDDLITMRRHENAESYLESFERCAEEVRNIKLLENEQLSVFSLMQTGNDEYEDYDSDEDEEQGMNIGF